jgi:hypothetical protein
MKVDIGRAAGDIKNISGVNLYFLLPSFTQSEVMATTAFGTFTRTSAFSDSCFYYSII